MPLDHPITADPVPTTAAETDAAVAAPRREKRLVPVAPPPRPARPAVAVRVPRHPAARQAPARVSAIESKVTALQDPQEILNLVRTEATLRRAQRLSGAGDTQRQTMRLLSVFMLFALLAAAIGAMWWLQTSLQGHRRHAPAPAVQPGTGTPVRAR